MAMGSILEAGAASLQPGADWATDVLYRCSKYARQVTAKWLGVDPYGPEMAKYFGADAIVTEDNFKRQNESFTLNQIGGLAGLKVGDYLFYRNDPSLSGHVSIYAGNGMVYENNSKQGKAYTRMNPNGITSVGRMGVKADPHGGAAAGNQAGLPGLPALPTLGEIGDAIGGAIGDATGAVGGAVGDAVAAPVQSGLQAAWDFVKPHLGNAAAVSIGLLLVLAGLYAMVNGSLAATAGQTAIGNFEPREGEPGYQAPAARAPRKRKRKK